MHMWKAALSCDKGPAQRHWGQSHSHVAITSTPSAKFLPPYMASALYPANRSTPLPLPQPSPHTPLFVIVSMTLTSMGY